jgi:hypothetical protein
VPAALYHQDDSWYSFLLEAALPKVHSVAGKIRSIEKSSDIGNRTCDLLACSIVPQPTMLSHAPRKVMYQMEINKNCNNPYSTRFACIMLIAFV